MPARRIRAGAFATRLLPFFLLGGASNLGAQTAPFPRDPTTPNCIPFGCVDFARYQQVYRGSLFGLSPIDITALTFFNSDVDESENGRLTRGTYQLSLSTTSRAVGELSGADLNSNVGADNQLFASFVVTGTVGTSPSFTIAGTPFTFNPLAGNLLLQVLANYTESRPNNFIATPLYLDATVSPANASRAYCGAGGATCNANPAGGTQNGGLVTRFTTAQTTVPEPGTWALVGTGLLVLGTVMRRRVRAAS